MSIETHEMEAIGMLDSAVNRFLEEAGALLESAAASASPVDNGQLKNSWTHVCDTGAKKVDVGSPLENAIWNEFGTGSHAENGDGRKGYWVFVKGGGGGTSGSHKCYTLEEAKQVMAILRKKGLEAYYTNGKDPQHTLQHAMDNRKSLLKKRIEDILKGGMK